MRDTVKYYIMEKVGIVPIENTNLPAVLDFFLIGKNGRDNSSVYNSVKYKVSDQHMFVE